MKYDIYKSDRESIIRDLEALEGVFVFPSQGYELSNENVTKFAIECILISYNANSDRPFETLFLKHLARLGEHAFYAVIETGELNKKMDSISPSTYMVNFITAMNYRPFFVTNGNILVCGDNGETFDGHQYGDIDRFVGNNDFNPLFVLLDHVVQRYVGETEYQTEKFKNAVIALQWVTSYGFPYKNIIGWDKNKIIDSDVNEMVMTNNVPFDINFIEGNPEYRFCRLIRFGLRELIFTERTLFERLLNMDVMDPISSLLLFEVIKKPITDSYISNVQLSRDLFAQLADKNSKKPEIFTPAFTIYMRISQPEGFTEKFLEEVRKYPTILEGMKWNVETVKTLSRRKQRYKIEVHTGSRVNVLELSKTLDEVRRICIRLLIRSDLGKNDLTPNKVQFWLDYLEITIPNINQEVTTACEDMFNSEFRVEQAYAREMNRLSDPEEGKIMFRLGFGPLSNVFIDWFTEDHASSIRLDRSDPFTKAAINYGLSGKRRKGLSLLKEVYELFNADRNSDMPFRFYNYIQTNERNLVPYLTKKHPMLFLPDEDYNLAKEDVNFFIDNYNMLDDIEKLMKQIIKPSKETILIDIVYKKLINLDIYKEKDLSYLDDICKSISLFFGAQYRKSLKSA
ncbi:MAG: hypothetical protein K8S18_14575 [Desulfobacula sp.]|nr:hypothetical protein [Desulfobacula sp.]